MKKTKPSSWEEELIRNNNLWVYRGKWRLCLDVDKVKSFISQLIQQEKLKLLEEIYNSEELRNPAFVPVRAYIDNLKSQLQEEEND